MSPEIDETNLPMILATRLCLARVDQSGERIEHILSDAREGKISLDGKPLTDVEQDASVRFSNLMEDVAQAGLPTALAIIQWLSGQAASGFVTAYGSAEQARDFLQLQIIYAQQAENARIEKEASDGDDNQPEP